MKVLIAGGGVAGIAAAVAAGRSGAQVTVLEASGRVGLDRALLPLVLSGECTPEDLELEDAEALAERSGAAVRFNERVLRVDPLSRTLRTGTGYHEFDSLVVATGSRCLDDEVKGLSKPGVFRMTELDDYLALSKAAGSLSHAVVVGSAPLSLVVAQVLSRGPKVKVFLGARGLHRLSNRVREMIFQAASTNGVELFDADADAVLGTRRAEAVMSGGRVHPCDGVVVLPKSAPAPPDIGCSNGSHGGLLVDCSMRTSIESIFAAGDCAELRLGSTSAPSRLHSSSRLMGDVAGMNAAGRVVRANVAGSIALRLFGVELCVVGISLREGVRASLDVAQVDSEVETRGDGFDGGRICTSVVYERPTRRVLGMQMAGPGVLGLSACASLAVASGVDLEHLAFHESPYLPNFNKDRSPIALTAAKALVRVEDSGVEAQGTHLRPRRCGGPLAPGGF